MKYRVKLNKDGYYEAQYKRFFWWNTMLNEWSNPVKYRTESEALQCIKKKLAQDKIARNHKQSAKEYTPIIIED